MALLLIFAIWSLATNSSVPPSLASLFCDDIVEGNKQNNGAHHEIIYPSLYVVEENQLICPANYLAHAGDAELVQHYGSVDARKHLELGVAGPISSVDRQGLK